MISATVSVNFGGVRGIADAAAALRERSKPPELERAFRQFAAIYRSAMQERFVKLSRGGGEWPPLADSTIKARLRRPVTRARQQLAAARENHADAATIAKFEKAVARARKKARRDMEHPAGKAPAGRAAILRDTGTLFNALAPTFIGAPGAMEEQIPYGIRVGYGGPAKHPKGGKPTIAAIASYHQTGGGHLPRRAIIVRPDASTGARGATLIRKAMMEIARRTAQQTKRA